MKKIIKAFMASGLALGALTGCGSVSNDSEKLEEITIAFLPNEQAAEKSEDAFQMLADEVKVALGDDVEVNVVTLDDYNAVAEAILTGTAQIAWESGATFVSAYMQDEAVQPILSYGPEGDPEKSGYNAYIATNISHESDFEGKSREEQLAQLKDHSFGFVSNTSTSGCLVPTTTFYQLFGPDGDGTIETKDQITQTGEGSLFSEVQYAGSHQASVELLLNDRVYGGAFCCNYAEGNEDQLHIIDTQFVPNGPMWVNTDYLDQETIDKLVDHFINLTPENAVNEDFFDKENGFFYEAEEDPSNYAFFETDVDRYEFIIDMYK